MADLHIKASEMTHEEILSAREQARDAFQLGVGHVPFDLHGDSQALGVGPRLPYGAERENRGRAQDIAHCKERWQALGPVFIFFILKHV